MLFPVYLFQFLLEKKKIDDKLENRSGNLFINL